MREPTLFFPTLPQKRGPAARFWRIAACALAFGLVATSIFAQTPPNELQLPQDAPPTGLQAPVPPPALPLPKADKPLKVSPGLNQLGGSLASRPLTINDVVAIALATNRALAQAEEALLHAQGRTQETRSAFNPTLGTTLSYTQLDKSNSVTFGGQTIPLVKDMQKQINVQATLPIDISGLLRAATDQAKFQEIATRLDINRARNQIVSDVKAAFYNVLRAQALVSVAAETLQNAQDRLRETELKLKAGTVTPFDRLRAQTDVANAQQQLIVARSNVSLTIASLNNTIGIDINAPVQISEQGAVETPPGVAPPAEEGEKGRRGEGESPITQLPNHPTTQSPDDPTPNTQHPMPDTQRPQVTFDTLELGRTYDAALGEALQTRPEIGQADTSLAAARKGILLAQRSQLPTLGLTWGLVYAPDTAGFAPKTTSWQAVAQISIPLYDGGASRARARQARADVATAETNRRQTVDLVTLDVRQAYLTLVQARDRVAVANQGLSQAREAYRLARVRFVAGVSAQAGVSPLLELSDAQAALTQAENNQVNSLYDYNNARAALDKAIGRYSYGRAGSGYAAPPTPKQTGNPKSGKEGKGDTGK